MEDFTKVVRVGKGPYGNVFCKIEWAAGKLSITGVEDPMANGNCRGACGQIVMHPWLIQEYAPGWSEAQETVFRDTWDRYHLNHMQPGSPAQTAFVRKLPEDQREYSKASAALAAAGLNPDPSYLHNGKPYKYGHAWLYLAVPEWALLFLKALPDTDITPAWV